MQSSRKPTPEQVTAAVARITAPHLERYFFERLQNPAWIEPLRDRGFFKDPPAPQKVDGGVRCRLWPQSAYLARMASAAPDDVATIFRALDTANWLVVRDMLTAAKSLPSNLVRVLVPQLGNAVRSHMLWYELDAVGGIVTNLARDSDIGSAIELTRVAFGGLVEQNETVLRRAGFPFFEALDISVVPALTATAPLELLELLLHWVDSASSKEHPSRTDSDDMSYLWRPAIEEHEQNRTHDFASQLVSSVREVAERAVRDSGLTLVTVLDFLQREGSLIGRRLALHLIGEFGAQHPALAAATMLDRHSFEDYRVKARVLTIASHAVPTTRP